MRFILFAATLVLSLAACRTKKPDQNSGEVSKSINPKTMNLENTKWKLVELNGEAVANEEPENLIFVYFQAEDKKVSGYTGCNRFSGTYTLGAKNALTCSEIIMTKMFCSEVAKIEMGLTTAIRQAKSYSFEGSKLYINQDNRDKAAGFTAVAPE